MEEIAAPPSPQGQPGTGSGLIIGKFMPPHAGHRYLIDFARNYVKDLTVLVCSIESEPIPGDVRAAWMREAFPGVNVLHHTDEIPREPEGHPDFWDLWRETIKRLVPEKIDFVFASEDYGFRLAKELGALYVPVDHPRKLAPASGSDIRDNPLEHWEKIEPCARPWFLKRFCIYGPESTGKTTLTQNLARHYKTCFVEEHVRPLVNHRGGHIDLSVIPSVARGQIASENALERQANRILFYDTDLITTTIWSDWLYGGSPDWVREAADERSRRYDLYLLLNIDVLYVDDPQRCTPDPQDRARFYEKCENELKRRNLPYVKISGDWSERFRACCEAVDKLLRG